MKYLGLVHQNKDMFVQMAEGECLDQPRGCFHRKLLKRA